jgi:hypothetical protein
MVEPSNIHTLPAPGVYPCQMDTTTACGACCDLHNGAVAALSRRIATNPQAKEKTSHASA